METGIFYLKNETFKRNTAAFKAPDDIIQICAKAGYKEISMGEFPGGKNKVFQRIWLLTSGVHHWKRIAKIAPKGSVILFQHPSYGRRIALKYVEKMRKKNGLHFIALIHDLESLRGGMAGVVMENKKTNQIGDNDMLKKFDTVICHNEHMRRYLIEKGFEPERLINLEIFDYLSDIERVQPEKGEKPSIAIAGNLAKVKAGYIPKIFEKGGNKNLIVNLYGTRYEPEQEIENLKYHGAFPPEELASHLEGDFGLIWDGTEASTCAGNTGEYLKYNNPHKASMYLSAGMPVIVWKQAAIADFVLETGVGIAVDDLYSLDEVIGSITKEEYSRYAENAKKVADRLRSGYYTLSAIRKCCEVITEED
ncbi:MAG: hypothetical protein J6T47_09970 [Lachnospiraceae bacterium]|nr:hypothetical protein [Lachnospiraceae bacterium]